MKPASSSHLKTFSFWHFHVSFIFFSPGGCCLVPSIANAFNLLPLTENPPCMVQFESCNWQYLPNCCHVVMLPALSYSGQVITWQAWEEKMSSSHITNVLMFWLRLLLWKSSFGSVDASTWRLLTIMSFSKSVRVHSEPILHHLFTCKANVEIEFLLPCTW